MEHRHRLLIAGLMVVAAAAAIGLLAPGAPKSLAQGDIIYVDTDAPGPTHDGSTWDYAFTDLQDALTEAGSGDQIWVAEGTYKPTDTTDRNISFQMKNGVAIYGGFAGGETELGQRDWEANETILSGDLNGDDGPDFANNGENSYHVFYHYVLFLDQTAVLDGFTVSGGNANGPSPHDTGGGMLNQFFGSPALINVTFSGNSGFRGGGMLNYDNSSPALTNCIFSQNHAFGTDPESRRGRGGGIYNEEDSSPALTNCTFSGNSADLRGGGMYNDEDSSPTLTDCIFSGNSANLRGGGMYNFYSAPVLTNATFSQNNAYGSTTPDGGGGIYSESDPYNEEGPAPTLTNCTFSGNSANYGGGMSNNSASPVLTNCTFSGNSAGVDGGGIKVLGSGPTLTNCTFSGNSAGTRGGGFWISGSRPTLTNCTFSGNSAGTEGGGMYISPETPAALTNCILWGDTPEEIYPDVAVITYSDVQGGYTGTGNIDADPRFVDAANGDFHLHACSPCIDTGDNTPSSLPLQDFEGDPRISDGNGDGEPVVDMGVDEVAIAGTCSRVYLPLVLRGY